MRRGMIPEVRSRVRVSHYTSVSVNHACRRADVSSVLLDIYWKLDLRIVAEKHFVQVCYRQGVRVCSVFLRHELFQSEFQGIRTLAKILFCLLLFWIVDCCRDPQRSSEKGPVTVSIVSVFSSLWSEENQEYRHVLIELCLITIGTRSAYRRWKALCTSLLSSRESAYALSFLFWSARNSSFKMTTDARSKKASDTKYVLEEVRTTMESVDAMTDDDFFILPISVPSIWANTRALHWQCSYLGRFCLDIMLLSSARWHFSHCRRYHIINWQLSEADTDETVPTTSDLLGPWVLMKMTLSCGSLQHRSVVRSYTIPAPSRLAAVPNRPWQCLPEHRRAGLLVAPRSNHLVVLFLLWDPHKNHAVSRASWR